MAMSRKHYREAAEAIRYTVDQAAHDTPVRRRAKIAAAQDIANSLATMFAFDNSRFDRRKFIEACGL